MSSVAIQGNASGAGVFTIASPSSASSYTATLPAATTTLVGTDATQTLTNKTIQGGAITSGTAVASTSGTSIDFTSIPSWVKRITLLLNSVSTSGISQMQARIGSGSFTTTGYVSSCSQIGSSNATSSTTGFLVSASTSATELRTGVAVFTVISGNTWIETGIVNQGSGFQGVTSGILALGGVLDRIQLTTVNGTDTFDAGTVNILYEG